MTNQVRQCYDANAELYASLFLTNLGHDTNAKRWLARFADLAAPFEGNVADLGCGPGSVVDHLSELGLTAIGYDLSPGQIAQARKAFPDLEFRIGDLTALADADSSVGGIVSRHSIIHLVPSLLGDVFIEWMRVLEPGAPVLISFFGAMSAEGHGEAFDHKVVTAYALFPSTVGQLLADAGFIDIEIGSLPPPETGRPFDQATVLACKPRFRS